jgi:hypothetical protein
MDAFDGRSRDLPDFLPVAKVWLLLLFPSGHSHEGTRRKMRIRITQQLKGSIDGIRVEGFARGCVYDVSTTLGNCLLVLDAAEPVVDDSPALLMPLDAPSAASRTSQQSFTRLADRPSPTAASRKKPANV